MPFVDVSRRHFLVTQFVLWCCAVLLQQIMQLTPAQIEGLPPEQKAQVLALQQQMVGRPLCICASAAMLLPALCLLCIKLTVCLLGWTHLALKYAAI